MKGKPPNKSQAHYAQRVEEALRAAGIDPNSEAAYGVWDAYVSKGPNAAIKALAPAPLGAGHMSGGGGGSSPASPPPATSTSQEETTMVDRELIRQARLAVKAGNLALGERLVAEVKRRRGPPNVFSVKSAGYRHTELAVPGGASGSMAVPLPGWTPDDIDFFGRPRRR